MKYIYQGILLLAYCLIPTQVICQPITIVELFTSQGCSSCPSADRLLKEAVNSKNSDGEIYGLSFHVSYWNRLGWKDPYSSNQFTERQKWYADRMGLSRIYTPQMIVDGQVEFVGSQKPKLLEAVKSSFSANKKTTLDVSSIQKTNDRLSVAYSNRNISTGTIINLAVVQKTASNHVPRGENRNKTLVHSNVVRAFKAAPVNKNSKVEMSLPMLSTNAEYDIVVYAQNPTTLEITAAVKIPF